MARHVLLVGTLEGIPRAQREAWVAEAVATLAPTVDDTVVVLGGVRLFGVVRALWPGPSQAFDAWVAERGGEGLAWGDLVGELGRDAVVLLWSTTHRPAAVRELLALLPEGHVPPHWVLRCYPGA